MKKITKKREKTQKFKKHSKKFKEVMVWKTSPPGHLTYHEM